ncbi:MAG TPA: amino acid adenylation domain-containing protein [Longimicrobium sp.]|nr:amino acid adenylation domain-containing protein [Longimicrobium sp.]
MQPANDLAPGGTVEGKTWVGHLANGEGIEDAYPLTPMQQAMLLQGERAPGLYVQQYVCTLREPLHLPEFRAAWRRLSDRHPVLRSSFHPDALPEPQQRVHARVALPWSEHDWRGRAGAERDEALRAFLREDRATPFQPGEAPLSRFSLFRLQDEAYTLVWTSHHALIDGRSRRILLREVFEDYQALRDGRELPAVERRPFGDYVRWLRNAEPADSRAFWEAELRGLDGFNELVPQADDAAGRERERHRFELFDALSTGLQLLAQREEITVNTVLQGAWALLLGRYTGDTDVVFGATRMCRRGGFAGSEEVVGLLTNTVPVRVRLNAAQPVTEYLDGVRDLWVRMRPHERTHLARIQEWRGAPGGSALFQSVFGFETETAEEGLRRLGEPWRRRGFDLHQWISYPLAVVAHGGDRICVEVVYDPARFGRDAIRRMEGHLCRILHAFARDADQPLGRIAILTPAERHHLIHHLNPPAIPATGPAPIHALLRAQAERTPDAVAVVCGDESLTYTALARRATQLARHLRARGVGMETRVGVCMERSPEMVIALAAILEAGGAYVPLDPANPAERLAFVLEDADVSLVLCDAGLAGRLPANGPERLIAEPGWTQAAGESAEPVDAEVPPHALAYVMYTSGSTGLPKGVAVEHRGVVRLVRDADYACLGPDETILQAAPVSFDASTLEIWGALLNGGRLALMPGGTPSLEDLACAIVQGGVTTLWLTAGLFQAMADEQLDAFAGVRQLLTGGDVVPVAQAAKLRARFPSIRLINGYGPTENTTFTSCWTVPAEWDGGPLPIGTPIHGTRAYLLDDALRPVPMGVPGELYAGGEGVARGYVRRPAATAERFVPDPFAGVPGARMYRTGDRARWKECESASVRKCESEPTPAITPSRAHALEFLGRRDGQVKLRGLRIETGEIEAALRAHPGVAECVVIVREDAPGEKRLAAYVAGEADAETLRASLRTRLPEYMVPAAFVSIDRLPLNANGKVDRRALPAPARGAGEARRDAPRTPVEEVLAGLWADVLRVERVGVEESFFELGGHSLLGMRLLSRVREAFGVELPVRTVFERPTVAAMAERVEEARRSDAPALPPVTCVDRAGPMPLSFAQERLWFVDRLQGASALYNVPVAWRLTGALDAEALERALRELIHRHEALRTTFREMDGAPVQVIAPFAGFALPVIDRIGLSADAREAEARRRAAEDAVRPFDLAAGPLFRATLLRFGAEDHVLLLCIHHVVTDGWSMGILFRELSALYKTYKNGENGLLPNRSVQYADFAVWHRGVLAGAALERQLAWWRERMAGAPELLALPTDHPRPAARTHGGAQVRVACGSELLAGLEALARREGATLYMVLLAAFQALLSRYGAGDDVVVGSPVAGRTRREVEDVVGFFVNTLPLRTDLGGDPAFRALLRRVREGTLGAFEHQDVPFDRLVAELQPGRSLGHAPLVQALFALEGHAADDGLAGLRIQRVEREVRVARFDLSLVLETTANGLRGGLAYSTDLYERATIERMGAHLVRVLEQVAADADVPLSGLRLADEDERRVLVHDWNRTARPYPRGVCLHERFASHAAARPNAVALEWNDLTLTYAQLDARTNQLAHHLRGIGVGPETRVGVLMERGAELIVSILAILKAGGCYVPLDPAYPAERLGLMIADAAISVVLTHSAFAPSVAESGAHVVSLDEAADAIAAERTDAPASGATAENLAYIVYTSGSTGRPKGVMVNHRTVVQLVVDTDYVRFGPGDRIAQASNASFDALAFEAWGAFLNGATLVGIDREVLLSAPAMRAFLREKRITTLYQTTALLNQLSREAPDLFQPLREVLFGGQAADADAVRRILRDGKPRRLLHVYGPTETTAWCSYEDVRHVDDGALAVSVGGPTGNQRIYLLDSALHPVPIGVPGEAYVGGDGVVRGYLDRPSLTAERFLPDPFSGMRGARMYRTGDKLRWKECESAKVRECESDDTHALTHSRTHALEFLGRLDGQVKIRGFRIEPGEVESVLAAHPAVREARVIVREDAPGEHRLAAYVVGDADGEALRAHLRRTLPEYMVPSAVVPMDRLPLTPNGKLDARALPAPELAAADGYVAPRTPAEEVLAGIWAAVLRLDRVGTADDFFALGGHSLLATRVVSRVREVFGLELPLRALFEGPTVAEVARRVDEIRRAGLPIPPAIVPVDREGALPLSFAQERLWFIDRMGTAGASYNVPRALRLQGDLDLAALERGLGEIVRRHEALRTTFREVDGSPVQVIAPFTGFILPVEDLSALPADAREAEMRRRVTVEAARPFELAGGPLFRAVLLRIAADEHVLVLGMHHVVSDGWSLGVLHRELGALYETYKNGQESVLPPHSVQYADFAVWQRAQLRGEALDRQLAWWKARLAGAPERLELPADHPRPEAPSFRGGTVPVELPAPLADRLRALGRGEGATLYMVLLAAFQVLLARCGAGDDVVVGSPVAGRGRRETEGLIGFFVNTLVLRTDLSGDPAFREALRRVREATLGAYEHQDLPFEKLVAELRPGRSLGHAPLFQVSFSLDNEEAPAPLAGLRVSDAGAAPATSKFDLSLSLAASDRGIRGAFTFAADLFERGTVERMAGHLAQLLEQVAEDADARISTPRLMGAEERARVVAMGLPRAACPAAGSLHGRFQAQARRTPDATALVHGGESLTYAELDARAERIARALRRRGVGPEVRVGLCLERSIDTVVALLAVLRAGGAYVPIDPAYPSDRIAYLLRDSGVALVLADDAGRAAIPSSSSPVLAVDALIAEAGDDGDALAADVSPENAAYVIYTSGSTGRPKGVVVTHAHVLRLFAATDAWFGFGEDDAWTLFHSYAFDFSVWEIWGALLYGGRLVVVPFDVSRDPAAFRALLARERVTVLNQTPSAFRQLMRADEEAGDPLALRWVVFGGEALEPRALEPWFARHGDARPRLVNMYGITETTVHVTFREITRADAAGGASLVGEPIPDLGVCLLDGRMEPVPAGVPGEIFVAGAGVARGYLGRPALTAERFVPDPFSGVPGARLYRSGDRARRRGDDLEYLGRGDQQVKVRGFRIEPGEIEAALLAQAGVREAVVMAREDGTGGRRLVAYIVGDGEAAPAALRTALAARLPDYMVPSAIVTLDALPLTAHGKVDRRALPEPDGRTMAEGYVAPRGAVEEALAAAWAETLGVERVGAHDNYFALGGDSMRALQALARARARGAAFSLADLFRYQTVAELAARVRPEAGVEGGADRGPFSLLDPADRGRVPAGVEDAYPMTRLQMGMLFHSEHRPHQPVYHNVHLLRVRAAWNEGRMRSALAALAARHPILRTSFDLASFAEPMQLVHRRVDLPLSVARLEQLSPEKQDGERDGWIAAERARALDWRAAPLIRFHVQVLGADDFRLGFTEHHAILDGWSVATLLSELFGLYGGATVDDAAPASVLRSFVALEREVLASAEARHFWAEVLEGSEPTLPASLGTARGAGNRLRREAVPAGVASALAAAARREGMPLKSLLLAAHLRVLAAAAGTDDVTTGVVVNGRPEGGDAERALGLFLNTVPCRVRLSGGSWMDLARAGFGWERAMLPFRRFPVAELQRMRGGQPPFAALFNFIDFQRLDGPAAREGGASARGRGVGGTNFPLAASFEAASGGLLLSLEYDAARFSDDEADTLLARYIAVLAAMAADPHAPCAALNVLTDAERDQIGGWSAGDAQPVAGTVQRWIAEQAVRTPDAPAVASDDDLLTYAELDAAANRLARVLRARGVRAGDRVAVCLERSARLPVALLAILRTGAAYVPLDSGLPAERLRWMLRDSGASVLLTRGALAARFAGFGGGIVDVDAERARIAAESADALGEDVHPEALAYVIYTSGSTGRPKGVGVPHRALANHMAWMQRAFPLAADDRVLQKTPSGFDASVWEFWAPLAAGATLVMAPPGAHRDPAVLLRSVRDERITILQLVPSVLRALLDESGAAACGTLRRLFCGGEALPAGLAARARELTGAEVINLYGPTEVCIDASAHVFAGEAGATVPIGRPVDNVRAHVLDAAGAAAAPGVPGELYLGGAQLARGYLGRPALTAERFVPDPFSAVPGARLYRTGDRVRWRECESAKVRACESGDTDARTHSRTHALEFLDRVDQQVKVRGYRVEPGEVESALRLHAGVAACAVHVVGDAGETRLVAWVVPAPGAVIPAAELRAYLRERLPEPMVPAAFVPLDALPLTPNGKLDRRALPLPTAALGGAAYVAPRDALELRLARLWEEVLGAGPLGVRDDFFDVGGHSLAALRLLAGVERITGRRLSLAALLAAPTVEHLAEALRGAGALAVTGSLVPLGSAADGARPLFVVHAAGGGVLSYGALARHLGPGVALYGLQSRGLEGEHLPRTRVQEMAAGYLAELREVQPEGPYRLGGWSMGGLVAFEMARMLEAAGETVELLALLDTRAPGGGVPGVDADDPALLDGFLLHLGLAPDRMDRPDDAPADERLRHAWEAARAAGVIPPGLELGRFWELWSVFRANVAAAGRYAPGPCAADLLLVLAEDRAGPAEAEAARWDALTTGRVWTRMVKGDHFALVREPAVHRVAALLARALERGGSVRRKRRAARVRALARTPDGQREP